MPQIVSSETEGREVLTVPRPFAPWWRETRATLGLAGPLVLGQIAQIAIGTTDVVMMGWLGPASLAAGALGHNLLFPLFLFGLGIASAVAPMAAQELGARNYRGVRRTLRQGLWVALIVGLLFSLVIWQGRLVLLALGQAESAALLAEGYLRAAVWSLVPALWFVVLRAFVTAHSRPRSALVVSCLGVGVNALGNYALMFGNFGFPRLELVGAGISTSLVNLFMFLAMLAFILWDRRFRRYAVLIRLWRPDWPRFREILRIGLPIGLFILAESGLFATAAFLMGLIGQSQLAAHAIALQCAAVAFMVPLGFSQAATVRIGLAVGRGDRAGVGRGGWVALALGLGFMTISALVFWFLPRTLVGFFLELDSPESLPVVELAVSYLAIAALFQLFDGAQVIGAGALRGLKDTRVPMLLAVFSFWGVGFPASAFLGFKTELGGQGVWIGLALGLAVVAVLLVARFHRRGRLDWTGS
jgi:MATE family multidrug resistance protein